MISSLSFLSLSLSLVALPFILVLLWDLYQKRKRSEIVLTDLEFLRNSGCVKGKFRRHVKIIMWFLLVVLLGLIWSGPILHSAVPVLVGGEQSSHKNLMIAIDISRSMGQPLEIPDKEERFERYGANQPVNDPQNDEPTRYESARQTFYNFLERFKGSRIGLILFSTEPFLARWPTVETDGKFIEVLEERLGPGETSQLQRFSSLTNIDEALRMSREVITSQSGGEGGAIILISDAEDELENMGLAIRVTRAAGIRLYTIGVGISEIIVEKLSEELSGDSGFRIFRVDSEEEMQEAYDLVSELEESPRYAAEEQEYTTDLRWMIALILSVLGLVAVFSTETLFHQSWISSK
jgi:hypothetical protein